MKKLGMHMDKRSEWQCR